MTSTFDIIEKRRVAIYIRVSTAEQRIDGYGLEAQQKRLKDYVTNNAALNLVTKPEWLYQDTHTGSDMNREGLTKLLEDVRKGKFDAVLVWKIDRLSRSLKHLLHIFEGFEKNNVSFISVQENIDFKGPIGKLIFQIFGAIAQFERELIKGRTQMGKIASAEMGNFTGTNVPYGYKKVPNKSGKGSRLELIPEERKWVQQIYDWYIYDDSMGDGRIAKKLNELKVPKANHERTMRASTEWTSVMVKTILTNPLYRGEFIANRKDELGNVMPEDQWTLVEIPACVSEFTFLQAQEARKSRPGGAPGTDYILSGKLIDMDLGDHPRKFSGAKRFKGGFSYRRKQFKRKGRHYPVFEVPGKEIEEFVWGRIMEALKEPEVFIKRYLNKQFADPKRIEHIQKQLSISRETRLNAELAIARIEDAYEEGRYSQEKMAEKVADRNKEIGELDQQIVDLESELTLMSSVEVEVKKLKDTAAQVKYRLDKLDRKKKKILCGLFIDKVEMRRRKAHGRWHVLPEVFFRFNPQKFGEAIEVGRTTKVHAKADKSASGGTSAIDGGRWLI